MKRNTRLALCGATAAVFTIATAIVWGMLSPGTALSDQPGWEAISPEVGVGKAIRFEVRLKGVAALPGPGDITVSSTNLSMAPDGMPTMTTPVKYIASKAAGTLTFESEIAMAGRWELKLVTRVPGLDAPLASSIILTAIDATPRTGASQASGKPRKIVYYRNPMGLADVSQEPKKDSMGMDYIPVYEDEVSGPPGSVKIDLDRVQRAGVHIQKVVKQTLGRVVLATGTVTPDEARVRITSAKFSGFVEKLHVAETGAMVVAGQPLMTVWIENGDLLRKQADYLTALRSSGQPNSNDGIERARRNLETFDFPKEALDEINRTRSSTRTIVMRSRAGGTVIEKPAIEGMRFDAGHMHFKIADLSVLWVIAEVAEQDLGAIRSGQPAKMQFTAFPGETFQGRVSFIYPDVKMETRTGRVRIELANPDNRIKIGLYADVEIEADIANGPVLTVPESAIIDDGERRVVMVSNGDGRFEPRDVVIGARGEGLVEIRKGLKLDDEVVTTGNFLVDAESNLRAALSTFTTPANSEGAKSTKGADKSMAAQKP